MESNMLLELWLYTACVSFSSRSVMTRNARLTLAAWLAIGRHGC